MKRFGKNEAPVRIKFLEYRFTGFSEKKDAELLMAYLDREGYEGFLEKGDELLAYLPEDRKDERSLHHILKLINRGGEPPRFFVKRLPDVNWNETWESGFQPIEIEDIVRIRASFHEAQGAFVHDLVIDPKMSFGTGHHETTRLMIRAMLRMDLKEQAVLDLGSGTGVLSIMACRLKARSVVAVDIDEWACRNCRENIRKNHCRNVEIRQGILGDLDVGMFDVVLANINRNVLLEHMEQFSRIITPAGKLIMSGIMSPDLDSILSSARQAGFELLFTVEEGDWHVLALAKVDAPAH